MIGRCLLFALGCWLALALPAWAAAPPAGKLIPEPVFGGECFLVELGRDHPERLLLIHGVGDAAGRNWDAILPELARHYDVLVPDLPGFGRSTKANRLYSPKNYAAFIDWLLRREPAKPTIVVGHSLGGAVALAYAGRYGQDLAGLVLVDAVGVLHRVTISKDFFQKCLHLDGPFFPAESENFFRRMAGRLVEKLSPPVVDLDQVLASVALRETTLAGDPQRIAGLALAQTDFTPYLAGVRTPTWLLWGEKDTVAPRRLALLLQGLLPRAELRLLAGLGHTPMAENPGIFARILEAALTTPPQPPPRPTPPAGELIGSCRDQTGVNFTGNYRRLEIDNCRQVTIADAYLNEAVINRSLVTMTNTVIAGGKTGLSIRASTLQATAVEISGETALVADQSRLDLAGVQLTGSRTAVRDERESSTLVFSVSKLLSGGRVRPIHQVVVLAPGEEL